MFYASPGKTISMTKQRSRRILMIRPSTFRKNEETAVNNAFQQDASDSSNVLSQAQAEFDNLVEVLEKNLIDVTVISSIKEEDTPDALFPNNWLSFHDDGHVVLYPMFAENRRRERREEIIDQVSDNSYKPKNRLIDLTSYEDKALFLEGTGSMVLDRVHQICYAAIGPRTHQEVLDVWGERLGYKIVSFESHQNSHSDDLIYHTNVMMSIGTTWAAICVESIRDLVACEKILDELMSSSKEIIDLSYEEIYGFGGNILEIENQRGESIIVMSETAFNTLKVDTKTKLSRHGKIVFAPIPTIEKLGGGSVRCMIAELF